MIFYFSATGNTKHVVDKIKRENEKLVLIENAVEKNEYDYEIEDGRIGILAPTYNWGLPSIVYEFLEKVIFSFKEKPYIFYVGTYGTTTGSASAFVGSLLKAKGLKLDAMFDIKMPDTWTVLFDLSNKEKVNKEIEKAETEISKLMAQLDNEITGRHMSFTTPLFIGKIGKHIYDNKTRKTSNLSATDDCIGCGLCAKKCPVKAIEIIDKKPMWVKEECAMCLGCLHRCPKFAIIYGNGKSTRKHGQYTFQKYASKTNMIKK